MVTNGDHGPHGLHLLHVAPEMSATLNHTLQFIECLLPLVGTGGGQIWIPRPNAPMNAIYV